MQQADDLRILDERLAQLAEQRTPFPDHSAPFASLAEAIVWATKVPAETAALESGADASRPMADVMEDEARLQSTELDHAQAEALNLENGLRLAHSARPQELALDSRDPAEDRLAGALISILVAGDFATVRTDDLGDEQYRYIIAVDWQRLDALSERIGLSPVGQLIEQRQPA